MLNFKKITMYFSIVLMSFGFSSLVFASEESLSEDQKNHMRALGFQEEIISSMTTSEFEHFEKVSPMPGELPEQDSAVYKITSDINDNIINVESYTELEAERLMELEKFQIRPMNSTCSSNTSCNSKTDWLSMTTTATKLTNGRIMLHNNFNWLKIPTITMTDMIGMNYNDSVVIEPNTTKFSYKYTDGTGTHSVGAREIQNNAHGIAATFNLKTYGSNSGPYNHNGYISVEVSKGNKYDQFANVFGQYTHTTLTFNITLSIRSGDIGLGMVTAEKKMPSNTLKIKF